jgi:hypothetical protein
MFNVYAVYRNQDMTEGRGPMVLDRLFADMDSAHQYANAQRGVMGRKPASGSWETERYASDWETRTLPVFSSLAEESQWTQNDTRARALNKLSPDERRVLGLS